MLHLYHIVIYNLIADKSQTKPVSFVRHAAVDSWDLPELAAIPMSTQNSNSNPVLPEIVISDINNRHVNRQTKLTGVVGVGGHLKKNLHSSSERGKL